MHLPLTLLSRLADYWHSLSDGTRDGIISGLVVAAVLAVVGLVMKFGKRITRAISHIFKSEAPPANQQQEVKVKIEVAPATPIFPTLPAESVQAPRTAAIPRPPAFGFVARRDQDGRDIVERLKGELAPESDQLIVLWGAGGVGKTTLAAETARALRKNFDGGIAWISAEGRPDFGLSTLLDEIAGHLRQPELRQLALEVKDEQVHQVLADAPTPLLVLDNFETISPEEQVRCAEWLAKRASCPVLITSRDAAAHARALHVLAMSLPEAREFLQKLIAQARNVQAFEGLDDDELIQAADRIPLVLQWLAKQIDATKEPQSVLDDLSQGKGDAAERVFGRSFELSQLGDDGRVVLLVLSLFVPSASRNALSKVSGFGSDSERLDRALQHLTELWLIETIQGNKRITVEGLTRELAKARLTIHDHADQFRQRFVIYFRDYASEHGEPTPENYDSLEAERDNLIIAADIALRLNDWSLAAELVDMVANPVTGVLAVHGFWDDAIRLLQGALQTARSLKHEKGIVVFAHSLATLKTHRGELDQSRQLFNECLQINEKLGHRHGVAGTLHHLAILAQGQGDLKEAKRLCKAGLEISRELGDQVSIASSISQLGIILYRLGDYGESKAKHQESLAIRREMGDLLGTATDLHQLAMLSGREGRLEEAHRLYSESLEISRDLGNQDAIATSLHELGRLAQSQHRTAVARRLYNESLGISRKLGKPDSIAMSLGQLARLEEDEGDVIAAARLFRECVTILENLGSPYAEMARKDLERVGGKSS